MSWQLTFNLTSAKLVRNWRDWDGARTAVT